MIQLIQNIEGNFVSEIKGDINLAHSIVGDVQGEDYINIYGLNAFLQNFSQIPKTEGFTIPNLFGYAPPVSIVEKTLEYNVFTPPLCPNCVDEAVIIGTQTWDKCNANVSTYRDGTPIPQVTDPTAWSGLTTGAWCYHDNDPNNEAVYGKMYNWYAFAGIYDAASLANPLLRKTFAPSGKTIPSNSDWTILINELGGNLGAGGKMKEEGFCHWNEPNTGANNDSGFTGLGAGSRFLDGTFDEVGNTGYFWSLSELDPTIAWLLPLNYNSNNAFISAHSKKIGQSVRFLRV